MSSSSRLGVLSFVCLSLVGTGVAVSACESDSGSPEPGVFTGTDASFSPDATSAPDTSVPDAADASTAVDASDSSLPVATSCTIDGNPVAAAAVNPANPCEQCIPATSTTAWSPRPSFPLLVGGTDVTTQGWTITMMAPNTLTNGADYVRLATSTNGAANTSGQLLIAKANAVEVGKPFKLQASIMVESVNAHNQLDSAAAILGSLTGGFGSTAERSQMIYLDSAAIGWADDTQSAAFAVTDGAYHLYELAVDAAGAATVSVDGAAKLTRNAFVTNGTIALGDQTNDKNFDGAMRIKSVTRVCPP